VIVAGIVATTVIVGFAVHPLATIASSLLAGSVLLAAGRRPALAILALALIAAFAGLRVDAFPR
jgi:hypothetical protein